MTLAPFVGGMLPTESVWGVLAFRPGPPAPIVTALAYAGVVASVLASTQRSRPAEFRESASPAVSLPDAD